MARGPGRMDPFSSLCFATFYEVQKLSTWDLRRNPIFPRPGIQGTVACQMERDQRTFPWLPIRGVNHLKDGGQQGRQEWKRDIRRAQNGSKPKNAEPGGECRRGEAQAGGKERPWWTVLNRTRKEGTFARPAEEMSQSRQAESLPGNTKSGKTVSEKMR